MQISQKQASVDKSIAVSSNFSQNQPLFQNLVTDTCYWLTFCFYDSKWSQSKRLFTCKVMSGLRCRKTTQLLLLKWEYHQLNNLSQDNEFVV